MRTVALLFILAALSACESSKATAEASPTSPNSTDSTIKADVWADNWFALYNEDNLVVEDSVPFNTERSFNTDTFQFNTTLPAQMTIIMKDFYEDDSGLEYIGSRRQQMGDGGLAAQFFDAESGALLKVSDDSWRCKVIHQAPLNPSCDRDDNPINTCQSNIQDAPENWQSNSFDDSAWEAATIHSHAAIRPHGGYRDAEWHSDTKLIWSKDLEVDNVILCRFTISALDDTDQLITKT